MLSDFKSQQEQEKEKALIAHRAKTRKRLEDAAKKDDNTLSDLNLVAKNFGMSEQETKAFIEQENCDREREIEKINFGPKKK